MLLRGQEATIRARAAEVDEFLHVKMLNLSPEMPCWGLFVVNFDMWSLVTCSPGTVFSLVKSKSVTVFYYIYFYLIKYR